MGTKFIKEKGKRYVLEDGTVTSIRPQHKHINMKEPIIIIKNKDLADDLNLSANERKKKSSKKKVVRKKK